jgi:lysophospholipase L1-like esterase
VRLVVVALAVNGIRSIPLPAGVAGDKSSQMLGRLERDVLSKQPNWLTLSCGVNDVWHGWRGVPVSKFKGHVTALVERTQEAGINTMLLTTTVIGEQLDNLPNRKLSAYNDFLRSLAKQKGCLLGDVNLDFHAAIQSSAATGGACEVLTRDGVHLNQLGNQVMATCILRSFGLNDSQLKMAEQAWIGQTNSAGHDGTLR